MRALVPEDFNGGRVLAEQRRSLNRALYAAAIGHLRKQRSVEILKQHWPRDDSAALMLRAAQSPLDRGQFPQLIGVQLLPVVAPQAAATQLFTRCLRLDLSDLYAINVPSMLPNTLLPVFIGEGQPYPVLKGHFNAAPIGPARKMGFITSVSRELEDSTPENASAIIGRLMSQGATRALDATVFDSIAADATRPPGLLNGVTPTASSPATGTALDAAAADVAKLVTAITTAGVIGEIVFIAHTARALALRMLVGSTDSVTVLASPMINPDWLIAVAVDGVASGYSGVPTIESNTAAEVVYETVPTEVVISGGVVGAPTYSAFQKDVLLLKLRNLCAWGVTQVGAVQYIADCKWVP